MATSGKTRLSHARCAVFSRLPHRARSARWEACLRRSTGAALSTHPFDHPTHRAATITSPLYLADVAEYEARRDKHSRFYHDLARARRHAAHICTHTHTHAHSVLLHNQQQEEYEAWWLAARRRTAVVINIANILERMDEQVWVGCVACMQHHHRCCQPCTSL